MPSIVISGVEVIFDECDEALVMGHRWWISNGYALTKTKMMDGRRRCIGMHRLILGDPPSQAIDHINRIKSDNRRCNLVPCTTAENCRNMPTKRGKSSRYRGVSWNKKKRAWQVVLRIHGRLKWHGTYESQEAAWAVAKEHFDGIAP